MRRKVYLAQMGAVDMGIDLRRRDVGVPQNLLQDTKIGTARKHMGCKRMTKRMGMQPLDTHQTAVALADGMNGLARYASAVLIQENTWARGDTTSMSRQLMAWSVEIIDKSLESRAAKGHQALFRPFTEHADKLVIQIKILYV